MEGLQIDVRKQDNNILLVKLAGDLMYPANETFNTQFNKLITGGEIKFEFNLSNLQYVDENGIGSLLACQRKIEKREGGELTLIGPFQKQVKEKLVVTGMDKIFKIYPAVAGT